MRATNPALVMVAANGGTSASAGTSRKGVRVAFAVKRQLGTAVERNRIKRRLRQALVNAIGSEAKGTDLLIIPKPKAFTLCFSDLQQAVAQCLAKVVGGKSSRVATASKATSRATSRATTVTASQETTRKVSNGKTNKTQITDK